VIEVLVVAVVGHRHLDVHDVAVAELVLLAAVTVGRVREGDGQLGRHDLGAGGG
jgi:hypothetical protein